jgi:hypothetical protein
VPNLTIPALLPAGRVGNVDVIPKPEDVRDLGALFKDGWALAAFFAITGYGSVGLLLAALRASMREHIADLKGSKSEFRESNPVLRELGDTLKAVQASAKAPEQSPLLRRVEELLTALEAERRDRRR